MVLGKYHWRKMNSNFTERSSLTSGEVSEVINCSLNPYSQTSNSERSEPTGRQYESLPFASTETTFSTNPFLPRMVDTTGFPNFWHNNIVPPNNQPTYLLCPYNSFSNVETPLANGSGNSQNINQNTELASCSAQLNERFLAQPRQSEWIPGSGSIPSSTQGTSLSQWEPHFSSEISVPISNSNAQNTSETGLNSWTNNSTGQFGRPTYLPNNNGIFGQPQLHQISNFSSAPSVIVPNHQFNPRIEPNIISRFPHPNGCVVITTVRRRYIYGNEPMGRNDPNIDAYAPGPSTARRRTDERTDEIESNRGHSLQSRSISHGNCRHFRPYPYLANFPRTHEEPVNLDVNAGLLRTQIVDQRVLSEVNASFASSESLNVPSTAFNPANRLFNNLSDSFPTNQVINRDEASAQDPFSIEMNVDESIGIDDVRPPISSNLPRIMRNIQTESNYPQFERMECNISNFSNHNSLNNSTHIFMPQPQRRSAIRNQFQGTTAYSSLVDLYEIQRRAIQNHLSHPSPVPNLRTTQTQIDTISNSQNASVLSETYRRKLEVFRSQLKSPVGIHKNFEIRIRRSHIFEDSYQVINSVRNVQNLKAKLWVVFEGETGLDYGGVQREWFCLLSRKIFNPNYGLFEYCPGNNYSLQINPNSRICNEQHLNYFMFIGRIVGMAVYHGKLLDCSFTNIFYAMLLQKKIALEDVEKVDPQYYKNLFWITENDPASIDLDFSVNEESLGEVRQRDLVTNGSKIPVTNQNKYTYIELIINWMFVNRIKDQMEAFLMGFHDLIPKKSIKLFNESELESLICGIKEIDVKDWKNNTAYSGGYYSRHSTIKMFWKLLKSFNNEMKAKLLQFVTGTSKVPMNGFKELIGSNGPLLFTIQKIGSIDSLPRAHTCFNRLDLPPYDSYEKLKEKLTLAIEDCEGFGGVD